MPAPIPPPLPDQILDMLNGMRGGFNDLLDLTFTHASHDEVVAEVPIGPHLHQPHGLVHGGVYSAIIETLASVGAALNTMQQGRHVVGLENSTTFLRAVREGKLIGRATPLHRGRRTHVWSVSIRDGQEREVASGRVRVLCIEDGKAVAGESISLKSLGVEGAGVEGAGES